MQRQLNMHTKLFSPRFISILVGLLVTSGAGTAYSADVGEPSASGKEPSAFGKEPSASGKEPSAQDKQPSAPAELDFFEYLALMVDTQEGWIDPLELAQTDPSLTASLVPVSMPNSEATEPGAQDQHNLQQPLPKVDSGLRGTDE